MSRHVLKVFPVIALAACAHAGPPAVNTAPIEPLLRALLADAARRSGVPTEQLRVVEVQGATWPDSALGCPEPGRLYMQVIVPGYRVHIAVDGGPPLVYHLSARGGWLHCPPERATPALPRGADPRV